MSLQDWHRAALALVGRYVCALAVALASSVAVAVPFMLNGVLIGFAGVVLGALWLPRHSRVIGSLLLTAVGLGFYFQLWTRLQYHMARFELADQRFPQFRGLLIGGLLAVLLFSLLAYVRKPANKSRQPTAAPPRLSTP